MPGLRPCGRRRTFQNRDRSGGTLNGTTDRTNYFETMPSNQRDALRYETPFQKALFLNQIIDYDLPGKFVEQQSQILKNMTKKEIDAIAKKRLPVNNPIITVVGNKPAIKPGLQQLDYEGVELDKEGTSTPASLGMLPRPSRRSQKPYWLHKKPLEIVAFCVII